MGDPLPQSQTGAFQVPVLIVPYNSDGQYRVGHMECQPYIWGFLTIGYPTMGTIKFPQNNQNQTPTAYVCSEYIRYFIQKILLFLSVDVETMWMNGGKR